MVTLPTHVHSTEQFPNFAGKVVLKPGVPTLGRPERASQASPADLPTERLLSALCSLLGKVLDSQLQGSASASQESLCCYYSLGGGHKQIKSKASQQEGGSGSGTPGCRPALKATLRGEHQIDRHPRNPCLHWSQGQAQQLKNTTVKPIIQRIKSES